jgi:hypothetical protein
LAIPFLPGFLGRLKPHTAQADETVEINGWILKKSDLA